MARKTFAVPPHLLRKLSASPPPWWGIQPTTGAGGGGSGWGGGPGSKGSFGWGGGSGWKGGTGWGSGSGWSGGWGSRGFATAPSPPAAAPPERTPDEDYPDSTTAVEALNTNHDELAALHAKTPKQSTTHGPALRDARSDVGHRYRSHFVTTVTPAEMAAYLEMARDGTLMGVLANSFPGGSTILDVVGEIATVGLGPGGAAVTMTKPRVTEKDGVIVVSIVATTTQKHPLAGNVCWSIAVDTRTNRISTRFDGSGKQESRWSSLANTATDVANVQLVDSLWRATTDGMLAQMRAKAKNVTDPHSPGAIWSELTLSQNMMRYGLAKSIQGGALTVASRSSGARATVAPRKPMEAIDHWKVPKS